MDGTTELRAALEGQYGAGLAMLRQCIERCPSDLWTEAAWPRTYWRIAYHALFYTHYYLQPDYLGVPPWEKHDPEARLLWEDDENPNTPRRAEPYRQDELLSYLDRIVDGLPSCLATLDLFAPESGFPWYKIPKLDHQLVNLRHLQGHVGQLSELLMARGIDVDWVGRRNTAQI